MASKKRSAQDQPWWSTNQPTTKKASPITQNTYTSTTIPNNAQILIQTERSALWVIPNFCDTLKPSDFLGLHLVSRPAVRTRTGLMGHAHRDAAFHMMSEVESLAKPTSEEPSNFEKSPLAVKGGRHSIYASVGMSQHGANDTSESSAAAYGNLRQVFGQVQSQFDSYHFNGCYTNLYRDGSDHIGAHADKEIGSGDIVAGVAFGATRTFRIRDIVTKKIVLDIAHESGMLLVMEGDFQKEFLHEVPVQKRILLPRISFTFRRHL